MAKIVRPGRQMTAEKHSDDPIVCKVCLACYSDGPRLPLVLHCRHTFCALCIADSLMTPEDRSKVFCPLCKSKTALGRKGIAGLPVNEASLELIKDLEKRKQLELMEREGGLTAGSDRNSPSNIDGPSRQIANPLGSSKPVTKPGQPKGILKVKPKQTLFQTGNNSSQSAMENGRGRISEAHTVVVKSVHRLHPPPQGSDFDVAQSLDASTGEAQRNLGGGYNGLDISEVDIAFPDEEQMISNQNNQPDILTSLPPGRIPDFLQPTTKSTEPNFIIQDTTADPYRIDNPTITSSQDPNSRIYPINALLYMASSEGIPLDQLGSSDPEMTSELSISSSSSSSLTESQRTLPSNAKYVGRFGNHSEKRQPGSFQSPKRISCSSDGTRLAISDPGGHGVHLYSSKGEFSGFFNVLATTGGICFLVDDHLAVATATGVQVHLVNGTHKKTIPISGVLAVAPLRQGFVAASRNRVSVCKSLVGSVVHSINGKRDAQLSNKLVPFEEIVDIAVNSKGELCILEAKFVLITDEEGVVLTSIQPNQDSPCGPIGRGIALASCPEDQGIVVVDEGNRRVTLFGPDGHFIQGLLNLDHSGSAPNGEICGVVITNSRRMFVVSAGNKMAEVRAYTF